MYDFGLNSLKLKFINNIYISYHILYCQNYYYKLNNIMPLPSVIRICTVCHVPGFRKEVGVRTPRPGKYLII